MDTIFTQLVNAGNGPAIRDGVDGATRPGDPPIPLPRRAEPRPAHPARAPPLTWAPTQCRRARRRPALELDDIQSGALHERPSPYVGTYLLLRIDDRAAGRELVRRLLRLVDARRTSPTRAHDTWITVAFTYQGLQALGVPQASLDSFAPEFREGMAARAEDLGDVGASDPDHWEEPLGTRRRARRDRRALTGRRAPRGGRSTAPARAHAGAARYRADLAPGLLPAARPGAPRSASRTASANPRRGQRPAPDQPAGAAAQGRRVHPGLPRRDRRAAADADARRPRPQRHLRRVPQAAHQGRGLPPVPARHARAGAEEELLGAKMVGRWQSGAPLALAPDARRPRARRRPAAQQRLPVRRRPAGPQVPGRAPTPAGPTPATPSTTTAASTSASTG